MHRKLPQIVVRLALTLAGAGAVALWAAGPVGAATSHRATLYSVDESRPLKTGGSATQFAISLTPGARCPTDTRTPPYYEVWGYVLPGATNPASVAFVGRLIDLTKGYPLDEYGRPFQYPLEPGTAAIINPGNQFSLSYFDAADLLKGGVSTAAWQIGLACVPVGPGPGVVQHHPTVIWAAHLQIVADKSDPHGFAWRVTDPITTRNASTVPLILGLVGVLVVGSALFLVGRRSGERDRAVSGRPTRERRDVPEPTMPSGTRHDQEISHATD